MRGGGAAWRILAIGAVVYFGFQVLREVSVVVLAVVLALFPAAVLWAPVRWLERKGWSPMPATAVVLLGSLALLVGTGMLIIPAIAEHLGRLTEDVGLAAEAAREWLVTGPFGLSDTQIDNYWASFTEEFGSGGGLTSGILGGATAVIEIITGFFVMLISVFFILKDGPRMVEGLLARLESRHAEPTGRALMAGWDALGHYMRGLALVGVFDAVLIGIGLVVVGVPLAFPLALLTFFGAFFPVIGAWTAGLFAVAVAFVNGGVTDALIVLLIITIVQQVEGDVIVPLVFGHRLAMHPLVILLAVAAGGIAFGIPGAFLSVPAVAVAITVRQELAEDPSTTFTSLAQGVEAAQEPVENGDENVGEDEDGNNSPATV